MNKLAKHLFSVYWTSNRQSPVLSWTGTACVITDLSPALSWAGAACVITACRLCTAGQALPVDLSKRVWWAPEQLRGRCSHSPRGGGAVPTPSSTALQRADAYSFGLVLYALVGRSGPWGARVQHYTLHGEGTAKYAVRWGCSPTRCTVRVQPNTLHGEGTAQHAARWGCSTTPCTVSVQHYSLFKYERQIQIKNYFILSLTIITLYV